MVDLKQAASLVVNDCVRIKPGEQVLIWGRTDCHHFCEELALQVMHADGIPAVMTASDDYLITMLTEMKDSTIESMTRPIATVAKESDAIITVAAAQENPSRFRHISSDKMAARRRGWVPIQKLAMSGDRRWTGMCYPTRGQAETYGVDFDTFWNSFWQALMTDYDDLQDRCNRVINGLKQGTDVHLTSPAGTDLRVSHKDRPLIADDGVISDEDISKQRMLSNLPAGEVFFAPVETNAEGRLVVDLAFWFGHRIEDLVLEFDRGKATVVSAKQGLDVFRSVLASSMGAKDMIGEFGIGLNPNVTEAVGYMLVDEKLSGSVHIALGLNTMMGGKNESDLHWDLLVLEPTVTSGNKKIIDGGKLVC